MNRRFAWVAYFFLCSMFWLTGCQLHDPVKSPVVKSEVLPLKTIPHDPAVKLEWGVLHMAGVGLPPKHAESDAQAKALARRAAIVDGQRNLARKLAELERQSGLSVSSSNPADITNFRVVEEKSLADGGYRVVLEIGLDASLQEWLRVH